MSFESLHQLKIGRGQNDFNFIVSLHVPLSLSAVVIHKRELKFVLILNRDNTIQQISFTSCCNKTSAIKIRQAV